MAAAVIVGPPQDQVILIANINPQNISFKSTVTMFTTDANTNANVSEGYIVAGPTAAGVTPLSLGNGKLAIPLTPSSSPGSPYLKIHFPTSQNGLNKLYVTYCVANSFMADGFYDYTTGVPTTYMNALRAWINTNPQTGQPYTNQLPVERSRAFTLSDYGETTNKPANSVTFFIVYQGTFSAALPVPTEAVVILGGNVQKFGT